MPDVSIELRGQEVIINGTNAGVVSDAISNYPQHATEIQALWDESHPPEPPAEPAPA